MVFVCFHRFLSLRNDCSGCCHGCESTFIGVHSCNGRLCSIFVGSRVGFGNRKNTGLWLFRVFFGSNFLEDRVRTICYDDYLFSLLLRDATRYFSLRNLVDGSIAKSPIANRVTVVGWYSVHSICIASLSIVSLVAGLGRMGAVACRTSFSKDGRPITVFS